MAIVAVEGGSVAVEELRGYPIIGCTRDAREVHRELKFAWADIDNLIAECYPAPPNLPGQCPNVAYLFVDSLQIRPFGGEDEADQLDASIGLSSYTLARASITYRPLPYDSSDRIQRKWSVGGEVMLYPAKSMKWDDGSTVKSDSQRAGKIIPMIEHSMIWNRVADVPYAAIQNCAGKVNENEFNGAAAETLLFMGAEISFTYAAGGEQVWTLEYRFQERTVKQGSQAVGWNYFWRDDVPGGAEWQKLKTTKDEYPYPTADFSTLFP